MQTRCGNKVHGATLVEMMMVATIIGLFFVMLVGYSTQRARQAAIDHASQQIQQILSASLSYYNANATWPTSLAAMQSPNTPYIPTPMVSPWGTTYIVSPVAPIAPSTNSILFQVSTTLPVKLKGRDAIGAVLAGTLPYGISTTGANTTVTATVNLPGQIVNNAEAVNFAGMYHTGTCVPVPTCPPTDAAGNPMVAEIMAVPSSVSGTNDPTPPPPIPPPNVYPLSSFTAYATSPAADPDPCDPASGGARDICTGTSSTNMFWRVCLRMITSKGLVVLDAGSAEYAVIMAMTRCSVPGEPAGDPFNVWGP